MISATGFAVLTASALPVASEVGERLQLLSEVAVRGKVVRLSDLLPAGASLSERAQADGILLGRTPLAGSTRVFTADQLRTLIEEKTIGEKIAVDIPSKVIVHGQGWPIESGRMQEALDQARPNASLDRGKTIVRVAPELTTRARNAALRAVDIRNVSGENRFQVRFECLDHSNCSAFWAEVISDRPLKGISVSSPAMPRADAGAGLMLVEPRRKARLVLHEAQLTITMQVQPLRPGRLGDKVRVFDSASRRTFVAEVRGKDLLSEAR